jgi:hypothetical protein
LSSIVLLKEIVREAKIKNKIKNSLWFKSSAEPLAAPSQLGCDIIVASTSTLTVLSGTAAVTALTDDAAFFSSITSVSSTTQTQYVYAASLISKWGSYLR